MSLREMEYRSLNFPVDMHHRRQRRDEASYSSSSLSRPLLPKQAKTNRPLNKSQVIFIFLYLERINRNATWINTGKVSRLDWICPVPYVFFMTLQIYLFDEFKRKELPATFLFFSSWGESMALIYKNRRKNPLNSKFNSIKTSSANATRRSEQIK